MMRTVSSLLPGRDEGEADVLQALSPESLDALFSRHVKGLGRLECDPKAVPSPPGVTLLHTNRE